MFSIYGYCGNCPPSGTGLDVSDPGAGVTMSVGAVALDARLGLAVGRVACVMGQGDM